VIRLAKDEEVGLVNPLCSQSAHAQKGKEIGISQAVLLARRTRTIRMCSFDARSEGQPSRSLSSERQNWMAAVGPTRAPFP